MLTPCDGTSTSEWWCCGSSVDCCGSDNPNRHRIFPTLTIPSASAPSFPTSPTSETGLVALTTSSLVHSASPASDGSIPTHNEGLSTGVKAGIGAGACLGGLAIFAFGFYIARWLQRRKRAIADPKELYVPGYVGPSGLLIQAAPPTMAPEPVPVETGDAPKHEMP